MGFHIGSHLEDLYCMQGTSAVSSESKRAITLVHESGIFTDGQLYKYLKISCALASIQGSPIGSLANSCRSVKEGSTYSL